MDEHFVEINYNDSPLVLMILIDEEDQSAELLISRDHFSAKRKYSFKSFDSLKMAQLYCETNYNVGVSSWGKTPIFSKKFEFNYSVSNYGTPQPQTQGFEEAVLKIEVTPATEETKDLIAQHNKIEITGNPAGLRKLAAQLLLCADSEEYDEYFHIHMSSQKSNLELTLLAPNYFKRNKDKDGELILIYDKNKFFEE